MKSRQDFNKTMILQENKASATADTNDDVVSQALNALRPMTPSSAHNTLSAMQQQLLNETLRATGGPDFLTWLDNMRQELHLEQSTKKGTLKNGVQWTYTGEVDEYNRMCGIGNISYSNGAQFGYFDYIGTFDNNMAHGVGTRCENFLTEIGEYKHDRREGKATSYLENGLIFNITYKAG